MLWLLQLSKELEARKEELAELMLHSDEVIDFRDSVSIADAPSDLPLSVPIFSYF